MLVAIAIPIFTSQLEKSRDAVTISNVRAAYAEAMTAYLTESNGGNATYVSSTSVTVSDVIGKGKSTSSPNLATLASELPGNGDGVTWTLTTLDDADGKSATLTFTFADGELTTVVAGAVS